MGTRVELRYDTVRLKWKTALSTVLTSFTDLPISHATFSHRPGVPPGYLTIKRDSFERSSSSHSPSYQAKKHKVGYCSSKPDSLQVGTRDVWEFRQNDAL